MERIKLAKYELIASLSYWNTFTPLYTYRKNLVNRHVSETAQGADNVNYCQLFFTDIEGSTLLNNLKAYTSWRLTAGLLNDDLQKWYVEIIYKTFLRLMWKLARCEIFCIHIVMLTFRPFYTAFIFFLVLNCYYIFHSVFANTNETAFLHIIPSTSYQENVMFANVL